MAPFIICRKANVTKLPFSNYINFQQFSNVSFSSSLTFVTSLHHLTHLTSAAHPPFSIGLIASHHNSRLRLTQHCSFQISFYKLKTKPNYFFWLENNFYPDTSCRAGCDTRRPGPLVWEKLNRNKTLSSSSF